MAPCPCFGGTARAKRTRWYWCCCCWCWWWWSRWFPFFGGTARARKMRYESKCALEEINVDQGHKMNAWLPKILLRVEMNPYWLLQLFQSDKTNGLCRINPVTKTGQRLYMVGSVLIMNVFYSFFLHLHCPPPRCTCCSCPSCRSLPWLCRTPPHSAPYSPIRWGLMEWKVKWDILKYCEIIQSVGFCISFTS